MSPNEKDSIEWKGNQIKLIVQMNLIVPVFNLLFHQPSIQTFRDVFSVPPLLAECLSEYVKDISSVMYSECIQRWDKGDKIVLGMY